MMTVRVWEDRLNYAGCDDVVAANAAAWREQQAMIEELRGTDEPPTPKRATSTRTRTHYAHSAGWPGRRIQHLRESLGLSQDAFARVLGIGQTTCSSWECGRTRPGYSAIRRLIDLERDGIEGMVAD